MHEWRLSNGENTHADWPTKDHKCGSALLLPAQLTTVVNQLLDPLFVSSVIATVPQAKSTNQSEGVKVKVGT